MSPGDPGPRRGHEPTRREPASPLEAPQATTASGATESSPLAGLSPGTRVGRYEVVATLGAGGMGAIYRARDPYLSRDVALKLLHRYRHYLPEAEEYQARLVREAQALARLSHPNVVAAHDVGMHDGSVFIAMELVAGVSMGTWLTTRPNRGAIMRVLVAAGRGLAAAHAAGVLHRDFKPGNVMVSPDGRVRVVDFGLARAAREPADDQGPAPAANIPIARGSTADGLSSALSATDLTREGVVMGTLGFMAPEQLSDGAADERADQFSYAATAFHALAGRTAFPCRSAEEYLSALARGDRMAWPAGVPRRLRRIVERGLASRVEDRFPSVTAMVDALERATAGKRRASVAIAAVAAVAGAGIAAVLAAPRDEMQNPCATDVSPLAGLWDGARRTAIGAAFAATGRPHASVAFQRVAVRLDEFETRWMAMRHEACEATHVRREQSVPILEARRACLDRKRDEMAALVRLFAEPSGAVVDRAVDATREMVPMDACSDVGQLMGESASLPDDPARRTEIAEIESELAAARAQRIVGRWNDALPRTEGLVQRAERAGHKPSLARATFELGILQGSLGRPESEATHHRALALASEAGLTSLGASISAGLLHLVLDAGRWRDGELLLPMVDAAVRQAGDPARLRIQVLRGQGLILMAKGEHVAAVAKLKEAESECVKRLGDDCIRIRLNIQNEIARALVEKGDYAEAGRKMVDVIAMVKDVHGPNHPRVLIGYNNLASTLVEANDRDGALAALAESRKLAATLRHGPSAGFIPATEGLAWQRSGDCRRAVPLYREALALFEAQRAGERLESIQIHQHLGECLVALRRPRQAIRHLEAWSKGLRAQGVRPEWQAQADFALARALWSVRSKRRRAVRLARGALELHRETGASPEAQAAIRRWLATHR